jgi:16S rRNA (cytosine1407-C5)-methyltransferase
MRDPQINGGLPTRFVERLSELVPPGRLPGVLTALAEPRATGFRINRLRADPGPVLAALEAEGLAPVPFEGVPGAYTVPDAHRRALTETAACRDGEVYLQNPASMLPPRALGPRPGERILDLAAAPGSKTLQLAELMDNQGWISAVESVRARFFRLRANLERHGAANVRTYLKDGTRVWRQVPERFDRVLLDAPCSSEGQFQLGSPKSYRYWSERKIREMSRKQRRLLYSAVLCARSGGIIVYSTCTLAPEENEAVVDAMLRRFGDALTIEPIAQAIPLGEPGHQSWRGDRYDASLRDAVRILPDARLEGFFICRLRKHRSTLGDASGAANGDDTRRD